jgi:hypothetical protein
MTTKTLAHLIVAAALAASAAASLQLAPSLRSALASPDLPLSDEAAPSDGALNLLVPAANRFVASSAGLRLAPTRIVRITP